MAAEYASFHRMKAFVAFDDTDVANLKSLAPVFNKHGPAITENFYAVLGEFEDTAKMIEGRVDALKATHRRWMSELFQGDYGEDYFNNRVRVGHAHVRIGLDPSYVEGVMTHLRVLGSRAIADEVAEGDGRAAKTASFIKILDLDLAAINLAYSEVRLDRLTNFTGMSRRLLERCITKG